MILEENEKNMKEKSASVVLKSDKLRYNLSSSPIGHFN
jgi:hypothetical protein